VSEGRGPVQIRPARPDEAARIAAVHDACWRATYRDMMPAAITARFTIARRTALWERMLSAPPERRCAYIAEDEDAGIVGCAWGGREESGDPVYQGELAGIYLLPAYQHRGLGRALIRTVAACLQGRGYASLLLWALTDNARARRFYEHLGGTLLRERDAAMDGGTISEVAYGWADIRALIDAASTP
jgi:ribosomal protein S18 acetylase RimI-like enzyme